MKTTICPRCEKDYEKVHPLIQFDYIYCKGCQEIIIKECKGIKLTDKEKLSVIGL
jgi:Pyruvate/2-oxoacid:ferredoxin oxidoreductase delta subunit